VTIFLHGHAPDCSIMLLCYFICPLPLGEGAKPVFI
jgi:hypothetical protein